MRSLFLRGAVLAACVVVFACVSPVAAQVPDAPGVRAQGMAGAFVAVADDASATWWNPAGLINAPLFDAVIERHGERAPWTGTGRPASDGGFRQSSTFLAFAFPSLGVSYHHTTTIAAGPPTAAASDSRQNDRPVPIAVSRLATRTLGLTLLQSITANLVVGGTVKVLNGSFAASPAANLSLTEALDDADRLRADGSTKADLDVGVLAWAGPVRLGLVGRNLARPEFGDVAPEALALGLGGRLPRQIRAGIALTPGFSARAAASRPVLTISLDADLARTHLAGADSRRLAAGVERWFAGRRLALRGGVQAETVGQRRAFVTAGASVAVRANVFVEAFAGRGTAGPAGSGTWQSWGVAGRAGF